MATSWQPLEGGGGRKASPLLRPWHFKLCLQNVGMDPGLSVLIGWQPQDTVTSTFSSSLTAGAAGASIEL